MEATREERLSGRLDDRRIFGGIARAARTARFIARTGPFERRGQR
ncbi:hypothetical protein [Sphingomonas sp.]